MAIWSVFLQKEVLEISFSRVRYKQLIRAAVDRCFSAARLIRGTVKSPTARDYLSYGGERMSGNAMERGA